MDMRILMAILLLLSADVTYSRTMIIHQENFERKELHQFAEFLHDFDMVIDANNLMQNRGMFKPIENGGRHLVTKKPYWVYLEIENQLHKDIDVLLMHGVAITKDIEVYNLGSHEPILIAAIGAKHAFSSRLVHYRRPSVPLHLLRGTNKFAIKVVNEGVVSLNFSVMSLKDFYNYTALDGTVIWSVFGAYCVTILSNALLYLLLKSRKYLLFVLESTFRFGCYFMFIGVFGSIFNWFHGHRLVEAMTLLSGVASTVMGFLFAKEYLALEVYSKRFASMIDFFVLAYIPVALIIICDSFDVFPVRIGALLTTGIPLIIFIPVTVAAISSLLGGHKPALFFLIAWIPMILCTAVQLLAVTGVIVWFERADLLGMMGGTIESCILSLALGYDVFRLKTATEILNIDLQEKSTSLELQAERLDELLTEKKAEIKYIMDHAGVGIFKLNSDLTIAPEFSRKCVEIFEGKDLAGENILHILFASERNNRVLTDDEILSLQWIQGMFGENPISFEINSHLLPHQIHAHEKFIDLDWSPIFEADGMSGVIITARDVTYFKKLEEESRKTTLEMRILRIASQKRPDRLLEYFKADIKIITSVLAVLSDTESAQTRLEMTTIMRDIHTLKGNARTYGLNEVAAAIHGLESRIVDSIPLSDKLKIMKDSLLWIRNDLETYRDGVAKFFSEDKSSAEAAMMLKEFDAVYSSNSDIRDRTIETVRRYLRSRAGFLPSELLDDLKPAANEIASGLGKEVITFKVVDNGFYVKKEYIQKISAVLTILIRNSVDHGLEKPDERIKQGKAAGGIVTIVLEKVEDKVLMAYSDDGKGLDMLRIYRKMDESDKGQGVTYQQVAENIFKHGFTVKDKATEISGRGVGMDAVMEMLKDIGSRVEIKFTDPHISIEMFDPINPRNFVTFYFSFELARWVFVD